MNRIKFLSSKVVFQEIPDEITLAINLTQCPHRCKNCHSPELRLDQGANLLSNIESLIKANSYITCVCFMGRRWI
jgi:anaerobic ribonucleoside-triphosphate reductase activating protein